MYNVGNKGCKKEKLSKKTSLCILETIFNFIYYNIGFTDSFFKKKHKIWLLSDNLSCNGPCSKFHEFNMFFKVFNGLFGVKGLATENVDADGVVLIEGVDGDVTLVDYLNARYTRVFWDALYYMWSIKDAHINLCRQVLENFLDDLCRYRTIGVPTSTIKCTPIISALSRSAMI
jgi:hypothetical protein